MCSAKGIEKAWTIAGEREREIKGVRCIFIPLARMNSYISLEAPERFPRPGSFFFTFIFPTPEKNYIIGRRYKKMRSSNATCAVSFVGCADGCRALQRDDAALWSLCYSLTWLEACNFLLTSLSLLSSTLRYSRTAFFTQPCGPVVVVVVEERKRPVSLTSPRVKFSLEKQKKKTHKTPRIN